MWPIKPREWSKANAAALYVLYSMRLTAESGTFSKPMKRRLKRAKCNKNLRCEDCCLSDAEYFITTGCFMGPLPYSYACEPNLPEGDDQRNGDECSTTVGGKTFYWHINCFFFGNDLFKDMIELFNIQPCVVLFCFSNDPWNCQMI